MCKCLMFLKRTPKCMAQNLPQQENCQEKEKEKKVTICSKEKKMLQYVITAGPF